ncbi:hypothetical protein [Halomicrococcus sp. NG-SE-24]|uniref:hypothetical protein n=1 Tax=Halomicrococcus sp. NG-SE-24 TaxID=3436928 RepID=UPI003D988CF3
MGLFEKLGRQVEQFKQTAKKTAEENASYRCQACHERFDADYDRCPECGAEQVTPTETAE